jgi:hypothetical protein
MHASLTGDSRARARRTLARSIVSVLLAAGVLIPLTVSRAFAAPQQLSAPADTNASHRSRWAPASPNNVQAGLNFGLLQLGLGGFNVAAEMRYHRWWFEYSHGMNLTLNNLGGFSLTKTESQQNLHIWVPFTTGFGVGYTLVDELWLGVEFKAHRYEVNAPGGPVSAYQTYSIGPVLGYKYYIWKGFYADAYARYWPNVSTSLDGGKIALTGTGGTVEHSAHDWGAFANISLGYMFHH